MLCLSFGGRVMRRREFITLVGGAAAWPLTARAQWPEQIRHIGVLIGLASSASDPIADGYRWPFRDAMQRAGWIEGKNIRVDFRFGGALADLSKTNASAAELVALRPEVIYTRDGRQLWPFIRKRKRSLSSSPESRSGRLRLSQ